MRTSSARDAIQTRVCTRPAGNVCSFIDRRPSSHRWRWRSAETGEYERHKGIQCADVPGLNVLLHEAFIADDIFGRPSVRLYAGPPWDFDSRVKAPPACDRVRICHLRTKKPQLSA